MITLKDLDSYRHMAASNGQAYLYCIANPVLGNRIQYEVRHNGEVVLSTLDVNEAINKVNEYEDNSHGDAEQNG